VPLGVQRAVRVQRWTELSHIQAERLVDEERVPSHIAVGQPPDLSLPNHVHHLVTLDGAPRRLE